MKQILSSRTVTKCQIKERIPLKNTTGNRLGNNGCRKNVLSSVILNIKNTTRGIFGLCQPWVEVKEGDNLKLGT